LTFFSILIIHKLGEKYFNINSQLMNNQNQNLINNSNTKDINISNSNNNNIFETIYINNNDNHK